MDAVLAALSAYAHKLTFDDLPAEVVHHAKRTLIDTLGCALGGYSSETAVIARQVAKTVTSTPPSRIIGAAGAGTSTDMAAFANAAEVRYLDCNDTSGVATGHPSDMIGALMAVAEPLGVSGRDFIAAMVAAYEVFGYVSSGLSKRPGWDQATMAAIGAAAGAGKLMGLDQHAIANAIAITVANNVTLFVTRTGELSMWKGCATAGSMRAGINAAQLAAAGMTGPEEAFLGRCGLWDQAVGKDIEIPLPVFPPEVPYQVATTTYKQFPSQVHTQGPISLALELRPQLAGEEIAEVRVFTFAGAVRQVGSEPEKWDPQTRETADHSMPYLVAVALQDGAVNAASFEDARIKDPALRPLLAKTKVQEDPDYTRRFGAERPCRVEVDTTAGRTLRLETAAPKGHRNNPLSDAEVEAKFHNLARVALGDERRNAVIAALWDIDKAPNLTGLYDLMVIE